MKVLIFYLLFISVTVFGQIPQGYYDGAIGLSGQELRAALQEIIDDHEEQSYASIWIHFQSTDDNPSGNVWDMYSDIPGGNPSYTYSFGTDQCGNYSAEGDCYNREHSFPKSWFNDAPPMVTDLFQIYPTDGYVNGRRSNYPYGETNNATWTSTNGSKLGNCSYTGYSGIVFEPVNEYKGDFARTYFYMMTRYMDKVAIWSSDMLSGNDLAPWAREMLLEWDSGDPVSQKEIDRNNSVYLIQNNRNPFIDHPEFTGQIWSFPAGISNWNNTGIHVWYDGVNINTDCNSVYPGQVTIYNMLGQPLISYIINDGPHEIQPNLLTGIYILVINSGNKLYTTKLIINK